MLKKIVIFLLQRGLFGNMQGNQNIKNEYPDFIGTTGYGTGEGLCGWNCRHSFQPWAKGLRNPWADEHKIDSEENKKIYEDTQKQRAMERSIRATKRKLIMKNEEINSDDIPDSEK